MRLITECIRCKSENIIEIDPDSIERDADGIRPCYPVHCEGCPVTFDMVQEWHVVDCNACEDCHGCPATCDCFDPPDECDNCGAIRDAEN